MGDTICRIEEHNDVTILVLTLDSVDEHQSRELTSVFSSLLDEGHCKIVLDLSNTVYVASMVLSSMMFFRKKAKAAGGGLVILGVNDRIGEILATTKLDKVFKIFGNKDEAIAYFEGKGILRRFLGK